MQERFRQYEDECGVTIRSGWIVNDVSMTIMPRSIPVTYRANLSRPHALLVVTMMIEVLSLDWPGSRFRVRFPLASDDDKLKRSSSRNRRDYRIAERRALRRLIPDWMLEQAAREQWEAWQLAEASGVDEDKCRRRVAEWQALQRDIIWIGECVDLDGPIPF